MEFFRGQGRKVFSFENPVFETPPPRKFCWPAPAVPLSGNDNDDAAAGHFGKFCLVGSGHWARFLKSLFPSAEFKPNFWKALPCSHVYVYVYEYVMYIYVYVYNAYMYNVYVCVYVYCICICICVLYLS